MISRSRGVAAVVGGQRMVRRSVLRAMIGIAAADAVLFGELTRAGADGMPRIYTRAEWGAVPPRHLPRVLNRPPDHIIVHHTASPNAADVSRAHAFMLSREIQRYHMQANGWDDIGEQLTISRGGIVMEGRAGSLPAVESGRLVVGAQSLHHNGNTIGIENEGTYTSEDVPARLWVALVDVCAWLCRCYRLDPDAAIIGHRDCNQTVCPGDALYRKLPALRREVAKVLGGDNGGGKGDAGTDPPPDERRAVTARHRRRIAGGRAPRGRSGARDDAPRKRRHGKGSAD